MYEVKVRTLLKKPRWTSVGNWKEYKHILVVDEKVVVLKEDITSCCYISGFLCFNCGNQSLAEEHKEVGKCPKCNEEKLEEWLFDSVVFSKYKEEWIDIKKLKEKPYRVIKRKARV